MPRDRFVVRSLAAPSVGRQLTLWPDAARVRRAWFPYDQWEEYHYGMWNILNGAAKEAMVAKMVAFTGRASAYGEAMREMVHAWPVSCAMNLTTLAMNRRAWIGHAACAFKHGAPEHTVREAWHALTVAQQNAANVEADRAIALWEETYGHGYR